MKGLLLKDFYMIKAYCRTYLLMAAIFFAVSLVQADNLFFVFYPCLFCGMIPASLLSYDERSSFQRYAATLPCTRRQVVSCKYLIGLFIQLAVLLLTGAAQGIRMACNGTFAAGEYMVLMLSFLVVATTASSISMPFMFKYGVERGRVAYYVMVGFVCACCVLFSDFFEENHGGPVSGGVLFAALAAAGVLLFIGSWCLSVKFYREREL